VEGRLTSIHILHELIFWSTGSFNTGDLAVIHPDGAIAIVDRSKDIIISGGEVFPLQVLVRLFS
jgi:acyl-CoA synthetase (AMP-forming)/AMP-acid ligase II